MALLTAAYALPRRYMRVKNRGVWFAICLITGFGFFTFLWLERCVAPDAGEPPVLKPRYAWGAVACDGDAPGARWMGAGPFDVVDLLSRWPELSDGLHDRGLTIPSRAAAVAV
ncbi:MULTISPECIES: hypothetical protein [unclassified Streptomyces]|uniref:hypothetical protein n=1 Tax=unclassified Streptomyces TaxID=2593676 RepID=UPI003D939555